jgi:tetratricopeptide (TPR) repeat protein
MDRRKYRKNQSDPENKATTTTGSAKAAKKQSVLQQLPLWPGILTAAIAFLVYAQTIGYGFALDDYSVILENSSTKLGIGEIGLFLKTSLRHGYVFISDDLYRPLTKSVYALQWSLAPNSAFPGHLMNVALFTMTCWIIYRSVSRWTNSALTGFITAALFAVMPVHTEAVANIKSIDEILAFLFGILSLNSFYRSATEGRKSQLYLGLLFFLLALASKESSITLLAVIPLVLYFFTDSRQGKLFTPVAFALVVVLFFLAVRQGILGENSSVTPSAADNMLMITSDKLTQKITAIALLGRYLWVTLLGFPLSFDLSYPALKPVTAADWQFLVAFLMLTALFIFALVRFKKRDPLSFALLFFFITASVSSNIFITIGTHWGERLMYLPSFGIAMAVAILINRYIQPEQEFTKRTVAFGITSLLVLVLGGITIARNPAWENNSALYASGLKSAPQSARTNYYMGNHLGKEEQWKGRAQEEINKLLRTAIAYLDTSIKLYPYFSDAFNQKGLCYFRLKEYDKAAISYNEGLKINPNDPTIHNNIGTIFFETRQYDQAINAFNKAVSLKPDYKDAWANLGSAYGTVKNYSESINAFNRAVTIDPEYAMGWYYLGLTWRFAGDEMKAQQFIAKAKTLNPSLN